MTVFKEYIVRVDSFVPDAIYERSLEEVVRCRDCKCYGIVDSDYETVWCDWWENTTDNPDGFCAWGERRD